ncbi:MAG: acid phosphatase [Xanthobacteraceae bacterium]
MGAVRLALICFFSLICLHSSKSQEGLGKIKTIVVIYAENRSFDHLYGFFPGATGIANATEEQKTQLDHDGVPLPHLAIFDHHGRLDPRFPPMPNAPFQIDAPPISMSPEKILPNPIHAFYHNKEQINGGKNNMFAAMSNVGGWVMGYFDGSKLRMWQWAREYTLADNFFMAAFGGSYLNHLWLVCACTAQHPGPPDSMYARLDQDGRLTKKPDSPSANEGAVQVYSASGGQVSPDGYSVNTTQPPYQPSGIPPQAEGDRDLADPNGTSRWHAPLPAQIARTIGDTLSAKGVSWAWYAGGWNLALDDGRQPPQEKRKIIYTAEDGSPYFVPHHQPFNYFARFAPGTADRAKHLKDGEDFIRDMDAGLLPQVAFYKPVGRLTQHPSYTDLLSGDRHISDLLERLRGSPQWNEMVVIVTYDENGGFWDHVPPPSGPGWSDRWGPGTRIPAIIVSPFARRGHVDHTAYDTTSILKFITRRFDLEPLPGVRENSGDLTGPFELDQ